jgi:ABC-type multidrug transport system ATPase subunit
MENILKTQFLTKKYSGFVAVDGMSVEVPKGSVFGLLGPNGSGKTTFLGMILGIIRPSSGNYTWLEGDEKYDAARIGGLLEEPNLMPNLTAMDHLKMSATIKGVPVKECRGI